jgi:iron complex transport system ATP-binding protein
MALLSAELVTFAYGSTTVLDRVSLAVGAGARLGILGPNGSGKTTLLRVLSGALQPTTGHVRLDGTDLKSVRRQALAQRLAVVPQETELAFDYSVLEMVLMGRYPHLGPFEVEGPDDLAAALAALDSTGTRAFADRPYRTLSGGEKQRVIIASALAQLESPSTRRPGLQARQGGGPEGPPYDLSRLLLLDEPTASLDLKYQLEIAGVLRRLHDERGISILLSTHDLHFVRSVCTDVVLLSRGRVLARGPIDDVLTPQLVADLYDIDARDAAPLLR